MCVGWLALAAYLCVVCVMADPAMQPPHPHPFNISIPVEWNECPVVFARSMPVLETLAHSNGAYTWSHGCDWKAKKESDTRSLLSPPGTRYPSWNISHCCVCDASATFPFLRCSFYLWFWFSFRYNIECFYMVVRNISIFSSSFI